MSNHTSNERRLAVKDASHKGHIMTHWSEVGRYARVISHGEGTVSLVLFRRHLDSVPKVSYCTRCGRSIVSVGFDLHGTALLFECDAPPIRLGVGVERLRELGVGR